MLAFVQYHLPIINRDFISRHWQVYQEKRNSSYKIQSPATVQRETNMSRKSRKWHSTLESSQSWKKNYTEDPALIPFKTATGKRIGSRTLFRYNSSVFIKQTGLICFPNMYLFIYCNRDWLLLLNKTKQNKSHIKRIWDLSQVLGYGHGAVPLAFCLFCLNLILN